MKHKLNMIMLLLGSTSALASTALPVTQKQDLPPKNIPSNEDSATESTEVPIALPIETSAEIPIVAPVEAPIKTHPKITSKDQHTMPDMTLLLELVINDKATGRLASVEHQQGHYYVNQTDLQATGLSLPEHISGTQIPVDQLPDTRVTYDGPAQRLLLNVPPQWLPRQQLTDFTQNEIKLADPELGALFNYTVYTEAQKTNQQHSKQVSAVTEQRLFGRLGSVSNTGLYQNNFSHDEAIKKNRYIRYDTTWSYVNEEKMISYKAGDVITGSLPWSGATRIGGFQISRSFDSNPNLITYPLPAFAGQATLPSTVDLYINSYKAKTLNVDPGDFVINSLPYINGRGEAVMITKDAMGREVRITQPFYIESTLLKKGLTDFSLSLGALRKNFALSSAEYGDMIFSSSARHGLTNNLTLEGHTDLTQKMQLAGAGITFQLGTFGVFNSAYTYSHVNNSFFENNTRPDELTSNQGHQFSFGYHYNNQLFGFQARRTKKNQNFIDLGSYEHFFPGRQAQLDNISGNINLNKWGSIGTGYFSIKNFDQSSTRLLNISYSKSLFKNINLYASLNKEIGNGQYSAQLGINFPLGGGQDMSLSAVRNSDHSMSYRTTYNKTVPSEGGLGWGLGYEHKDNENQTTDKERDYAEAHINWRTSAFNTRAGVQGDKDLTYWGEISGTLIAMHGNVFAANKINDAFVLVSTEGHKDIPVYYENQKQGVTNSKGYLLLPSVTPYYMGQYSIDPMDLPAEAQIPVVEQSIAIRKNNGYVMKFPIKTIQTITLTLLDETGQPLPAGSAVQQDNIPTLTNYVGWDGITYLEQTEEESRLKITYPDKSKQCVVILKQDNTDKPLHCIENIHAKI